MIWVSRFTPSVWQKSRKPNSLPVSAHRLRRPVFDLEMGKVIIDSQSDGLGRLFESAVDQFPVELNGLLDVSFPIELGIANEPTG